MSIKTGVSEPTLKYWKVCINKPTRTYTSNILVCVVAMSIEECCEKVRDKYPDCTVVSINHVGAVDIV